MNRSSIVFLAALALPTAAFGQEEEAPAASAPTESNQKSTGGGGAIINKPGAGYGTGMTLSFLGGVGGYGGAGGLGIAGIFGLPLVPDGFIPSLNESFHLELGAFTNFGFRGAPFGDIVIFTPAAGVRWDFHIVKEFTAFAAIRSGVGFGISNSGTIFYFDGLVGGFWRFSQAVAVRFEVGGGVIGGGVSGGIAVFF